MDHEMIKSSECFELLRPPCSPCAAWGNIVIQEDCFLRTQGGGGVDRLDVTVYLGSSQFQVQKIEARLIFS